MNAFNVANKQQLKKQRLEFFKQLFGKDRNELDQKLDNQVKRYQTKTRKSPIATDYKAKTLEIAKKSVQQLWNGKKHIEVSLRIPCSGHLTTIDALNYMTKISVYCDEDINSVLLNKEIEQDEKNKIADEFSGLVAERLNQIFGKKFTQITRRQTVLHGYKFHYTIGDENYTLGKLCFGGNNNTVLIMITGKGCYMADNNWEFRLYDFLKENYGYLTRIDICLDDFNGEFSSAEQADQAETQEKFMTTKNQVRPKVQQLGDWKHHTGDGRTLQVGRRENGKMFRGYEKGKQLGDKESRWFRSEVEFKKKDRELPLDMLLHPTDYFAGAYPYCYELVELKQKDIFETVEKIQIIKKDAEITTEKSVSVMKKQFGKHIKTLRNLITEDMENVFGKPKDTILLDLLQTDLQGINAIPKRLRVTDGYFEIITEKKQSENALKALAESATIANHRNSCYIPIPF